MFPISAGDHRKRYTMRNPALVSKSVSCVPVSTYESYIRKTKFVYVWWQHPDISRLKNMGGLMRPVMACWHVNQHVFERPIDFAQLVGRVFVVPLMACSGVQATAPPRPLA